MVVSEGASRFPTDCRMCTDRDSDWFRFPENYLFHQFPRKTWTTGEGSIQQLWSIATPVAWNHHRHANRLHYQYPLHRMTTVSDTSLVFKMPRFQSPFGACRRCLTSPASSPRLPHLHTSTIISSISRKQKPCSNPGSRYPLIKTRKPLNYGLYKVITVSRLLHCLWLGHLLARVRSQTNSHSFVTVLPFPLTGARTTNEEEGYNDTRSRKN